MISLYARDIGLSLPGVESLPLFDASLQTLGLLLMMKRVRHDETVPQFTKFRRSAKLGAHGLPLVMFCMFFMLGSPVQANPEESFIDMLNALQKALAGAGFISSGDGTNDDGPGDGDAGGSGPSAKEYWISDVDPIAQSQCKGCHQTGGTAANSACTAAVYRLR